MLIFFFFFSSRRRHTRLQGDWSSDVCSSDLRRRGPAAAREAEFLYVARAARLLRFGQAYRLPDFRDLSRVVVPVVLEQRAHEGGEVDLFDPHDLLEEGNARLAMEIGLAQPLEVVHHVPLLALDR